MCLEAFSENTLRLLCNITPEVGVAFLVALLLSRLRGSYLFSYVSQLPAELVTDYYDGVLYWLTAYLTLACFGISAYRLVRATTGPTQSSAPQRPVVKRRRPGGTAGDDLPLSSPDTA